MNFCAQATTRATRAMKNFLELIAMRNFLVERIAMKNFGHKRSTRKYFMAIRSTGKFLMAISSRKFFMALVALAVAWAHKFRFPKWFLTKLQTEFNPIQSNSIQPNSMQIQFNPVQSNHIRKNRHQNGKHGHLLPLSDSGPRIPK